MRPILASNRIMFLACCSGIARMAVTRIGTGRDALHTPYRIIVSAEDRDRAGLVLQIVAVRLGMPVESVARKGRLSLPALRAKRVTLYLCHVALGWTLERVGHAMGVNRQTVSTACARLEEARDEPHLNDLLDQLAEAIQTLCDAPVAADLSEVA